MNLLIRPQQEAQYKAREAVGTGAGAVVAAGVRVRAGVRVGDRVGV